MVPVCVWERHWLYCDGSGVRPIFKLGAAVVSPVVVAQLVPSKSLGLLWGHYDAQHYLRNVLLCIRCVLILAFF